MTGAIFFVEFSSPNKPDKGIKEIHRSMGFTRVLSRFGFRRYNRKDNGWIHRLHASLSPQAHRGWYPHPYLMSSRMSGTFSLKKRKSWLSSNSLWASIFDTSERNELSTPFTAAFTSRASLPGRKSTPQQGGGVGWGVGEEAAGAYPGRISKSSAVVFATHTPVHGVLKSM